MTSKRLEASDPVEVVRALNVQRGCPHTMGKAACIGMQPVETMSSDARKAEYYLLLDTVIPEVIEHVREFRRTFPQGLVRRDEKGQIISALADMQTKVAPYVTVGDFATAAYWVHDAVYTTIDIATEKWLRTTDTDGPVYRRINALVDDERQAAYGGVAVQKRVSSAANQTVHISAGLMGVTERQFTAIHGRRPTPQEMTSLHAANLKFAMPLTNLHLRETRPIREVLGSQSLPGGRAEVYTHDEFFALTDTGLQFSGDSMVAAMAQPHYSGEFPDGRIGCPGARYVPEIWQWTGQLSEQYAFPALTARPE